MKFKKIKFICVEQTKIQRIEPTPLRVHNDDVNVALAYKIAIDSNVEFYENQVSRNNKLCEEIKNGRF